VPANIWVGLESRYQLIKARLEEKKHLQRESAYPPRTPYKQLARQEKEANAFAEDSLIGAESLDEAATDACFTRGYRR
jgi:hypothetical protein